MQETEMEKELVTPGEVLGKASDFKAGKGAYVAPHNNNVYASLTGRRSLIPPSPDSSDQRPTIEVTGHKAHGAVPKPGSVVIARVTKVMARMASADIMCVGPKSVREKFTGIIRGMRPWVSRFLFGLGGLVVNIGVASNTVAELWGTWKGLWFSWEQKRLVILETDSQVAISLSQNADSFNPNFNIILKIRELLNQQWNCRLMHIWRESNQCADYLAKAARCQSNRD